MFDKPCGHALIGFENLRILVLFREPGYADKLVGQDDIGNGSAFRLRQVGHAVIAPDDIPVDLQLGVIVLSKGF